MLVFSKSQTAVSSCTTRRSVLAGLAGGVAGLALPGARVRAQDSQPQVPQTDDADGQPDAEETLQREFSFDWLTATMRDKATRPHEAPTALQGYLAELDYDDYRNIAFRPERARWDADASLFRVHAFHLGWLYNEAVHVHEVEDGFARPMRFSTDDFEYRQGLADRMPEHQVLPGVSGFRLHFPINRADILDELIAFAGASYFRALGRGSTYGLSARGLAINTGLSGAEEFPRFSEFWLEKPAAGATQVVVNAALESPSVTGAYRFVIRPGETTEMEVTARLFFRREVEQLGVAPLTSMFLFAQNNRSDFDDYRPQVHDSNGLRIVRADGEPLWRALNNPPRLGSSYFSETGLREFGLMQRERAFSAYQDAGAHYESRPSVAIEPLGDWGEGAVRLVEIPSDLEVNDNIAAFWVPAQPTRAGEAREYRYILKWGNLLPDPNDDLAHVHETRTGEGGVSGVDGKDDNVRKFVIDFKGGLLSRMPGDAEVSAMVSVSRGTLEQSVLSKIEGTDLWRLVLDVNGAAESSIELVAHLAGYDRKLSETWLYQWMRDE